MKYDFIFDESEGCVLPKVDEPFEIFGDWLRSDIQDKDTVKDALDACMSVRSGKTEKVEFDGNAYVAIIEKRGVSIECMYNDETSTEQLKIKQVEELLKGWKEILRRRK